MFQNKQKLKKTFKAGKNPNEYRQHQVESVQKVFSFFKIILYQGFIIFSMILDFTIPGIILNETIPSRDSLY